MGISIQVKDMNNIPIKHAYVVDENDLDMASTYSTTIDEWIEENTTNRRLINLVIEMVEMTMKQTVTYIIRHRDMQKLYN